MDDLYYMIHLVEQPSVWDENKNIYAKILVICREVGIKKTEKKQVYICFSNDE